jgi:acetyl esterase
MPLHPEAAAFLEQIARQNGPSIDTLPIDVTRRALLIGTSPRPDHPGLAAITNRQIERPDGTTLPVRVYVPEGPGPFGVCLYFHGGGWVLNNMDTHDELVRRLAMTSGCVFVNVDYRLAPEHKFPAAIEDAYTAVSWVHDRAGELNCDPRRIAVSGDSAGGNLAAVVCLMSRDRSGPPIAFQVLIYPITDCDFDRPSYLSNAEGYFLTRREMLWFWKQYVSSPDQMRDPYTSPILAASLKDLPPAFILTAEYDPLRDEGEAYAEALRAAGVAVQVHRYDGMMHAFVRRVQLFEMARDAVQRISQQLRDAFGN